MARRIRRSRAARRYRFWAWHTAETVIVTMSIIYVVTNQVWALAAWEILAIGYLADGFATAWQGTPVGRASRHEVRTVARRAWLLPLVSSGAGINSALEALLARSSGSDGDILLAIAAALGVVLSWALLHAGFALIYESIDNAGHRAGIRFPGEDTPTRLNYLYFSYTIGTSFAAASADILTTRMRRIVLIHGVVSFLYNALVVAVAFQVLQYAVALP